MKGISRRALPTLIALLIAGLWGALLGYRHYEGGGSRVLERAEATLTDLRMLLRGARTPPGKVVIVAVDDEVVGRLGSYPIPRAELARLVDALRALDPRVIAIDMLLLDKGDPAGDAALVAALRKGPSVIAGAASFAAGRQRVGGDPADPLAGVPEAADFLFPMPGFADAAAVGIVNVSTDESGTPRFLPMLFRSPDRIEASFPLTAAVQSLRTDPAIEANGLVLGGRTIATDIGQLLPLAFYGPRGTIPTFSAADLLDGRLPADAVRDRVAVIGATVTGGGDVFPTPFDPVMPGVEVVSTAISHLLTGDGLRRDKSVRLADAAIAVALPMLLVGLLTWRRSLAGLTAIAALLIGWLALNMVAFANGIWMSLAVPLAATIPPVLLYGALQLWLDRRSAQYFAGQSALLREFQAPGLGDWLARHPDFLARPLRCEAAVVFIDLSGFTGVSETVGPVAVRELLNTFHGLVSDEVVGSGGVITGFSGDGAMILFGLPEPGPKDAATAAACCVGLAGKTRAWRDGLPSSTGSRIGFKLGAHFGPVVASRLGGAGHQHITASGDTVNVASRLMEVAAAHEADLALSAEFLQAAGPDLALRRSGALDGPQEVRIRGRSGKMTVWFWRA